MVRDEPVIAGVAQRSNRIRSLDAAIGPEQLLVEAGAAALHDAGARDPHQLVDAVVVLPFLFWSPPDPADLVARGLGLEPRERWVTANGGEIAVVALNWAAQRIAAGDLRAVLIVGANGGRTLELAGRVGAPVPWVLSGDPVTPKIGHDRDGHNQVEAAAGMDSPVHIYPLFENALRAAAGRSLADHQRLIGEMFARFTAVAARNEHAWFPVERSAEELVTPTADNRIIGFPYTKLLNAVMATDQAAAALITSRSAAHQHGVPDDRLISWWGGAHDEEAAWFVSSRPDLSLTPSMASAHERTLKAAGIGIDEVAFIDLYSCFPSAVEMACKVLGLDPLDARGLTVAGGLPYAGGPGSVYPMLSLACMVDRLREHPDDLGFLTGNGWYLSKASSTVLGARPRPDGPGTAGPPFAQPGPLVVGPRSGLGRLASYTVAHDRTGDPVHAVGIVEFTDRHRTVARWEGATADLTAFEADEQVGTLVDVIAGDADNPARFIPH